MKNRFTTTATVVLLLGCGSSTDQVETPEPTFWENVHGEYPRLIISRAKIHGGWLVVASGRGGLTFVPDADHEWTLDK